MKYISLTVEKARELPFYLAMEEYVARHLDEDEAFFMWQVEPTVIFGRNQLIEKEVNLSYCKQHGISAYRRKSGGGCVYADMGNIMFSFISKEYNVADAYRRYLDKVVCALNNLGVGAVATGRNDIEVDNKKISGNAFYHVNNKSVVHGTMLYDTDIENMVNAITPATVKLTSKGVDSVRGRITTLNRYIDISINEFKDYMRSALCDECVELDADAEKIIEEIEQSYLTERFIWGNNPHCNIVKEAHVEGAGNIKAFIEASHGIIKNINLMGDFFLNEELDDQLLDKLVGVPYNESAISDALNGVEVDKIIMNLNTEQFIKLIII